MEDTVKRNRRQYEWKLKNTDRISMAFTRGLKEKLQAAADAAGMSKTQYTETAILEKIARDKKNKECAN
jgi:hypothetical protein